MAEIWILPLPVICFLCRSKVTSLYYLSFVCTGTLNIWALKSCVKLSVVWELGVCFSRRHLMEESIYSEVEISAWFQIGLKPLENHLCKRKKKKQLPDIPRGFQIRPTDWGAWTASPIQPGSSCFRCKLGRGTRRGEVNSSMATCCIIRMQYATTASSWNTLSRRGNGDFLLDSEWRRGTRILKIKL